MKRLRATQLAALAAASLLVTSAATASAQDHEKCYKISTAATRRR